MRLLIAISLLLCASVIAGEADGSSTTLSDTTTSEFVEIDEGTTSTIYQDTTTKRTDDEDTTTTKTNSEDGATTSAKDDDTTNGPITDGPDHGNTPESKDGTTTEKVTEVPVEKVQEFEVECDTDTCTYSLQVPGLDQDTYDQLLGDSIKEVTAINEFEEVDMVSMMDGVDKVLGTSSNEVISLRANLEDLKLEITDLSSLYDQLQTNLKTYNEKLALANYTYNTIPKTSCIWRTCVTKETTTKKTTTTIPSTTPAPRYCDKYDKLDDHVCANEGTCVNWYDGFKCNCTGGNLDGDTQSCKTSACSVVKTPTKPGLILSPGYDGKENNSTKCATASWTIDGGLVEDSTNKTYLIIPTDDATFNVKNIESAATLKITVGKYNTKITSTTSIATINKILKNGNKADISYTGATGNGYFSFTLDTFTP